MDNTPAPITDTITAQYVRPLAEVLWGLRPAKLLADRVSRAVKRELRAATFPARGTIAHVGGWCQTTPGRIEVAARVHVRTDDGVRIEPMAVSLTLVDGTPQIVAVEVPHFRLR
jgi:hypothetical protein